MPGRGLPFVGCRLQISNCGHSNLQFGGSMIEVEVEVEVDGARG